MKSFYNEKKKRTKTSRTLLKKILKISSKRPRNNEEKKYNQVFLHTVLSKKAVYRLVRTTSLRNFCVISIQQLKDAFFSCVKVHYMQTTSPFPVYALRLMSSYLQYKNCAAMTQKCKACGSKLNQIVNGLQW